MGIEYRTGSRCGNVDLVGELSWVKVVHSICISSCTFKAISRVCSSWKRLVDSKEEPDGWPALEPTSVPQATLLNERGGTKLGTFGAHRAWKSTGGSGMYMLTMAKDVLLLFVEDEPEYFSNDFWFLVLEILRLR